MAPLGFRRYWSRAKPARFEPINVDPRHLQ
jgi:hypothetical protein